MIATNPSDSGFNNTKNRGVTTGERLLHLVENPAYMAKNRYGCPEEIEMGIDNIKSIIPVVE